ncbi:MAG: DUF2892 domain-containing protein [Deltaproteobacteria bacterium]|nr:DUF2892 domain-containing protein [Deltaproteobacteria bacterium]
MKQTCNIDQKGKKVRIIAGSVLAGLGLPLLLIPPVGLTMIGLGAFMIYEGKKGWCALRAIGIKTPL